MMHVTEPSFARYPAAAHAYGTQTGLIPTPTPISRMAGMGGVADMPFSRFLSSPIAGAYASVREEHEKKMLGIGELTSGQEVGIAVGAVALIACVIVGAIGYAGYTYGKHVAPSSADEKKWGWYGALSGLFFGPLGLGVLAVASEKD